MPDKFVRPPRSTLRYWFLKLGELLAIADEIVRQLTSYLVYPAILVPEVINTGHAISKIMCTR